MGDGFSNGRYQVGRPVAAKVAEGLVWSFISHGSHDRLKEEIEEELQALLDTIKNLDSTIASLTRMNSQCKNGT